MRRREFIALFGAAIGVWPLATHAQQAGKLPVIGFLGANTPSVQSEWTEAFVHRLRELGWTEDHNIRIEYRWAEGRFDRSPKLADELVQLNVDVIVTHATANVLAAKQATSSIPIVFAAVADPVGNKLVASLAQPGANVTGLSNEAADLAGKRLELLREITPRLRRVAMLANVATPNAVLEIRDVNAAAPTLDLEVIPSEIRKADDIGPAIDALKGRAEALYVQSDPLFNSNRVKISTLAVSARLPTVTGARSFVDAGALMSYGPNFPDLFRRAAEYVDKILMPLSWPRATRAQPATPVVGFLYSSTMDSFREFMTAFNTGLAETGYVEGRNVAFEYRLAENHFERLPALADDLVRDRVGVIVTAANVPPALAAKATTQTVPIVFMMGGDPVENGLVATLARPGGNVTGITILSGEVTQKRLALLHELVPTTAVIAYLVNPTNTAFSEAWLKEQAEAANRLGVRLLTLNASSPSDIEHAFATLVEQQAGALLVGADTFFAGQRDELVALSARYRIATSYFRREFIEAGGLMSYAATAVEAFRQTGVYVGRILKGENPCDLPVEQSTKFELVINMKTARTLGLTIPAGMLAIADEVME